MPLGAVALVLLQATPPGDVIAPPTGDVEEAPATTAAPSSAPPPQAPAAPVPAPSNAAPAPAVQGNLVPIPAAPPSQPTPIAPPDRAGTSLAFAAEAYYQRIYDVPIYGGGLWFGVGPFKKNRTLLLTLALEHGNTDQGLSTWGGRLLFAPEWALDRVRLGFGFGAGYLQIARVTTEAFQTSFTLLCGELHGGVDLVNVSGSGALFLRAALHLDLHFPAVWGPTLSLGYRSDAL